ncbi:MAG: hypothetical protein CVV47_09415 [Spirochaetae bacterium HGW-Spirochaetae-3]|jgi:TolB-like protein|nr:MAG: hypothetical protein CVV47_09415 [Spirochaetae bacterium HGW-Spirochaetae-3]
MSTKKAPRLIRRVASLAVVLFAVSVSGGFAQEAARTLSVLYFSNTTGDVDSAWLSKGLADMLVTDLANAGGFQIIEREELERLFREQELSLSGMVDDSSAPRIGRLLSAGILVYGSFAASGTELRADARAVETESGKILCAASVTGRPESALSLERELAAALARGLGADPARFTVATESLPAARSYYRGLDYLDAGCYADAVDFFGQSSRQDPLFLKPGKGLEEAYRYLKDFKRQRYRREMNALAADIADLSRRITAPVFYSFGDAIADPARFGWKDAAEVSAFYNARPAVLNGETPVQAIWNLQNLLGELGDKAEEYFDDETLAARCRDEILRWADAAESGYPGDAFLPEVIYQRLFVSREREDWKGMKAICERLMGDYPEYRMMWAVEDMYEEALGKLGE